MLGSVAAAFTVTAQAATPAAVSANEAAERRSEALVVLVDLLKDHLRQVRDNWDSDIDGSFAATILADDDLDGQELASWIATGLHEMAGFEFARERMGVALTMARETDETAPVLGGSQEDEHSCFSDNTHRDTYLTAGLRDIYSHQA